MNAVDFAGAIVVLAEAAADVVFATTMFTSCASVVVVPARPFLIERRTVNV